MPSEMTVSLLPKSEHGALVDVLDANAIIASMDRNLRNVLLHMIAETARHAGHADITRETLDGTRGI